MVSAWSLRASWRFFRLHPNQLLLTLLGLALGVAIATSVILSTSSARKAFELSTDALYGQSTHQIVGGSGGVPTAQYRKLRMELGLQGAPIIEGLALVDSEAFNLLGIAPLAESSLRPQTASSFSDAGALQNFVGTENAIAMDQTTVQRLGLTLGDSVDLLIDGNQHRAVLVLMLPPSAGSSALILTYIENARHWLRRGATLDRIDLKLSEQQYNRLQRWLPPELRLIESSSHRAQMQEMTSSFNINLTAMSLLALLVGAFIMHNTMSFLVVSRRQTYAIYRSLGVKRSELLAGVVAEAAVLSLVGSTLGALLGFLLAEHLIILVTQTINDLYFVLTVRDLQFDLWQWLLALGLGTVSGTLSALPAAVDAAGTPPGQLATRSSSENSTAYAQQWLPKLAFILFSLGTAFLVLPGASLLLAFIALFALVLGYALWVPAAALRGLRTLGHRCKKNSKKPSLVRISGWRFQHAVGALHSNRSRYGVALAALTVALSATLGVDVMVSSFRSSVSHWLSDTLRSDIYLAAPSSTSSRADGDMNNGVKRWLEKQSAVKNVTTSRIIKTQSRQGTLDLMAIDPGNMPLQGFKPYPNPENRSTAFINAQAVQISEPLARKQGLVPGGAIELFSDRSGWQPFLIAHVFRDYGSSQGRVVMHRDLYNLHWNDSGYSSLGIQLHTSTDHQPVLEQIRAYLKTSGFHYLLRDNFEIQQQSLAVFDRTFAITYVLKLLTVGVAFLGLFSALMSVLMEKTREFAVFRALGATHQDIRILTVQQSLIVGGLAGLLAIPLGVLMATILIHVINLRSFGWSIEMQISAAVLLYTVALGLGAALLASVWPAQRMRSLQINRAMRME